MVLGNETEDKGVLVVVCACCCSEFNVVAESVDFRLILRPMK